MAFKRFPGDLFLSSRLPLLEASETLRKVPLAGQQVFTHKREPRFKQLAKEKDNGGKPRENLLPGVTS